MRVREFVYALFSCATVALLAACGGSQPPIGAPSAMQAGRASSAQTASRGSGYAILHDFGPGGDRGHFPMSNLLDVDGTLYGTANGGTYNDGIVFEFRPRRSYKVLYNFRGSTDGGAPTGSLINVKGVLYGTTVGGGAYGYGTVFSITTSGSEKVIYSFTGGSQGLEPKGPLLYDDGALYGTTYTGGTGSFGRPGIVFAVTLSGHFTVLHSFTGAPSDGFYPNGGLINVGGTLYGTTALGGSSIAYPCDSPYYGDIGCGTVFSITTSGVEKVVYSFNGAPDGARPSSGLTKVGGTMYGTTAEGGAACPSKHEGGCGTVFSVDTSGREAVLHSFTGPPDGEAPAAPLLALHGTLYGTTIYGGNDGCRNYSTCGTVFAITRSGIESVLHQFTGHDVRSDPDGDLPYAGLIRFNGALVGATVYGGSTFGRCQNGSPYRSDRHGCGTIFSLPP